MSSEPSQVPGTDETNRAPLDALEVLNWTPAQLTSSERLLLFTLIYSLRPARYLEVGTYKGGSALIVAAAMDAVPYDGRVVCVDFKPQIDPSHWNMISHRTTMVTGYFGEVLEAALEAGGGPFDFIFIDADHTEESVLRDAGQALSVLSEDGYILFHDSYHPGVLRGTDDFSFRHTRSIVDFGTLTREYTLVDSNGLLAPFCGFRLMQRRSRGVGSTLLPRARAVARSVSRAKRALTRRIVRSSRRLRKTPRRERSR